MKMKKTITAVFVPVVLALAFQGSVSAVENTDLEKALEIQKNLQQTIKKVKPAYIFFGRGGSAVCISEDGYFVTNNHVAQFARNSGDRYNELYFSGGKKYSGTVIWYDPGGDLALCKLDLKEGEKVPFAKLGDSDALNVGDQVFAIGNPFSLGSKTWDPTVTFGVVSALRRSKGWYSEAIQTDASVNPGNSGGPLFNIKGEIVGINGMIEVDRPRGKICVGIGYAVPATQIKRFIKHYKGKFEKGGNALHGMVNGLAIDPVHLGRKGGRVNKVTPNSTADKAGFKAGDIIVRIAGKEVVHHAHVNGIIHTWPEESELEFVLERGEETLEITVKLDARKLPQRGRRMNPRSAFLGVGTSPAQDGGLEVTMVSPNSGAKKAGLQVGDVILKLDGVEVNNSAMLGAIIRRHKAGDKIKITYLRDGEETEVEAELQARGTRR